MKEYKYDTGKPKLSLVPQQILTDIARIREYGVAKYGDAENWRKVEPERYFDACLRHLSAMVTNGISAIDSESGLPLGLKTELIVTTNLREWRHILRLRTSAAAHPQMRQLMSGLLQELKTKIPVVFDDISIDK